MGLTLHTGRLAAWLAGAAGARSLTIEAAVPLAGGAVQRHWRLDCVIDGKPSRLVLRADPDIALPESLPKADEFAVLARVHAAGVPVSAPLWLCEDPAVIGRSFLVSAFVSGEADRVRLTANADNRALLADLGRALAAIHGAEAPGVLPVAGPRARVATLAGWRDLVERAPPQVLDGLGWLRANAPEDGPATLVHRDFRTGNFLVEGGRLAAVLDWEFAGAGDPQEDIGWFCAACWRGEAPAREAGGLGARADFLAAYEAAGGEPVEPGRVRFWEVFAHVRWALIAMAQGQRAEAGEMQRGELEEAVARVPGLARDIAAMTEAGR